MLLAAIGAAYIVVWPTRDGPIMHSDSYEYLSAATIVAERNPLTDRDNSLLYFAPLYPFVLGGLARSVHVSIENAARTVSAGVFGLNIYLAGRIVYAATASAGAGAMTSLVLLASPRFRLDHAEALSDSLFALLCQAAVFGLMRYEISGTRRWIAMAALTAGMSSFTRHIGYATVMATTVALVYLACRSARQARRWPTLVMIVGFTGVGLIPSFLWHWRNLAIHGVLAGSDAPKSKLTLLEAVSRLTADTGQYWSWSTSSTPADALVLTAVLATAVVGAIWVNSEHANRGLFGAWVFASTYAVALAVSATTLKVQWRSEYGEPWFIVLNGLFIAGCHALIPHVRRIRSESLHWRS